jgi:proline racemase
MWDFEYNGMTGEMTTLVNAVPAESGMLTLIEPERNAVVIEMVGKEMIVHVECKDQEHKAQLIDLAREVRKAIEGNS